ncbi:MAG TPA: MarR family transcriptional regulator [Burkholderiaceae bacterium]|nr:MarR family transcriptional regulator [Burkholderiaceae bacterium]
MRSIEESMKPATIPPDLAPDMDYGVLTELVGYCLRRAQIRIYQDFQEVMESWSITPPRFSAMILIRRNSRMKLTELARAMGIARSGAVEVVNSLAKLGYVRRCHSETDRRAYALELTDEGSDVLDKASAVVQQHDARISARLSEDEHVQLRELLNKLG